MVWDQIAGNWKQLIGAMQERWGKLTHNDLAVAAGDREQLLGLLQERYGYERAKAEGEFDKFTEAQNAQTETEVEDCTPPPKL